MAAIQSFSTLRRPYFLAQFMSFGFANSSAAFNPAEHGTAESFWEAALLDAAPLALPSSAILIVSPHPDDEVLGAGGLIRRAAHAGNAITILSVTDGEAAYPNWEGLDRIRRREVRDALSVLVPQTMSVRHLRIPDGKVDENRAALFDAIDRQLSRNTVLVAPYERDGHPDHDATGEVCCDVARLHNLTRRDRTCSTTMSGLSANTKRWHSISASVTVNATWKESQPRQDPHESPHL